MGLIWFFTPQLFPFQGALLNLFWTVVFAGALLLGSSDRCANQGFLYNDRVLGLQFHPEMTRDGLSHLIEAEKNGADMLAKLDHAYTSAQALQRMMLDNLKF